MKRFVTDMKVFAEVHGGSLLWETYRDTLTIRDSGEVIFEREPAGAKPSSSSRLTGSMLPTTGDSWTEIHLFRESSSKKLVLYALEVDDHLICAVHSEFNESSSSELFHRER